jgi:hypothetical protein
MPAFDDFFHDGLHGFRVAERVAVEGLGFVVIAGERDRNSMVSRYLM